MKSLFKIGLGLCVIACFAFTLKPSQPSQKKNTKKVYTIVLDAGHGGKDSGNQSNGIYEKDITLKIAQKIKAMNTNNSFKFYLTRDSDNFMSLDERVKKINGLKPDLVISIHVDSYTDADKEGVVIYQPKKNKYSKKSKKVAIALGSKLVTANPNFSHLNIEKAGFKVLKETKAPAVMLELGYLSNTQNRNYIGSADGQVDIAQKILSGLSGK